MLGYYEIPIIDLRLLRILASVLPWKIKFCNLLQFINACSPIVNNCESDTIVIEVTILLSLNAFEAIVVIATDGLVSQYIGIVILRCNLPLHKSW